MIYLWPKNNSMEGMHENFGVMTSPFAQSIPHGIKEGRYFAVDNNAFGTGFDESKYFCHLEKLGPYMDKCLFIVCPDKLEDAAETNQLFDEWSEKIRPYGPVAFVAQDGQEKLRMRKDFDWLFVGGSTSWKMGEGARICIREAKRLDKKIHVGRVNSIKRFRYFKLLGCQSSDGTRAIYNPTISKRVMTYAVSELGFNSLVPFGHSDS